MHEKAVKATHEINSARTICREALNEQPLRSTFAPHI
jgi:hypothetical protein